MAHLPSPLSGGTYGDGGGGGEGERKRKRSLVHRLAKGLSKLFSSSNKKRASPSHPSGASSTPTAGKKLDRTESVTKRKVFGGLLSPASLATLEEFCQFLEQSALDVEGLFRIPANSASVAALKGQLEKSGAGQSKIPPTTDPHVVACTLKAFLRELYEPLLTFDLYDSWVAAQKNQDLVTRLNHITNLVRGLPDLNLRALSRLVYLLARVSRNNEVNRMTASNLAITIGHNLLRPRFATMEQSLMDGPHINGLVETLVECHDYFFGGNRESLQDIQSSMQQLVASGKLGGSGGKRTRCSGRASTGGVGAGAPPRTRQPASRKTLPPETTIPARRLSRDLSPGSASGSGSSSPSPTRPATGTRPRRSSSVSSMTTGGLLNSSASRSDTTSSAPSSTKTTPTREEGKLNKRPTWGELAAQRSHGRPSVRLTTLQTGAATSGARPSTSGDSTSARSTTSTASHRSTARSTSTSTSASPAHRASVRASRSSTTMTERPLRPPVRRSNTVSHINPSTNTNISGRPLSRSSGSRR